RRPHSISTLFPYTTLFRSVEDAAVHHVFDGGWIWVLRFNNGITSAGVAANDQLANALGFSEGAPAWKRLLRRLPTLEGRFDGASDRKSTRLNSSHRTISYA